MDLIYRITGIVLLAVAPSAFGLAAEGDIGGVHFGVYAPDWTWQGRDANVMAVLENTGGADAVCSISLAIPEEFSAHFGRDGAPFLPDAEPFVAEVTVPAGETRRVAVTGLTALHSHPRQTYPLTVTIRAGDRETTVAYPLRTIRGQAVSEGRAVALGAPIGVALIFAVAFLLVLRNTGDPHAWKIVGAPAPEPTEPESWINETPK